ncbi:Putative two-component membrane permease complex subunit SMU_747c [Peribacillus frigoritolerans]|uniref:permease n=1 Tax=Peribacillus frigoritolerans TaxID=450367 RepID=UPI001D657D9B|nr:permease [Peribacillus frigoritolerans]CAH0225740.1 Putative two-component membrane permease complex subunit SMU_747c [Peribacillus frigoritolerans]
MLLKRYAGNLLLLILLFLLLAFFFLGDVFVPKAIDFSDYPMLHSVLVVFLGLFLESIPFLFLGAIASSFIQLFISEEIIQRMIPKRPLTAIFAAIAAALIIPVCECAIIPVVRRLIQKGVPVHAGVVLLVTAPILNVIVFGSTYYAFQNNPSILYGRIILCVLTAIIAGLFIHIFSTKDVVKEDKLELVQGHVHDSQSSKWTSFIDHTSQEFFMVGRYFIIGALFASVFQVFMDRSVMADIGQAPIKGTALMMGFAFVLSLCSSADAFVAASFSHSFLPGSILGFLVFGPMLDLKNVLIMMSCFKRSFVVTYVLLIFAVVFSLCLIAGGLISKGGF